MKNARLNLTLYSSGLTQPIVQCNMALEPHCNADFKTGAEFEKRTKNAQVMAKKLNSICIPIRWVFWARIISIYCSTSNLKGYYALKYVLMVQSYCNTYLP